MMLDERASETRRAIRRQGERVSWHVALSAEYGLSCVWRRPPHGSAVVSFIHYGLPDFNWTSDISVPQKRGMARHAVSDAGVKEERTRLEPPTRRYLQGFRITSQES